MNTEIKTYNELNHDEYFVLTMFRTMKIEMDKAKFQLQSYQLAKLVNSHEHLKKLREDIQADYFELLEKIDERELATIDVKYEKWNEVRTYENTNWNEEVELISQFKYYFDDLLMQLNDGTMEQRIIEEEKLINE